MRALITGVTGFVGPYLAARLIEQWPDAEVWGLVQSGVPEDEVRTLVPALRLVSGDLTDASSMVRALGTAPPDVVFHLAALSTVGTSWTNPAEVFHVNAIGQIHLFEAMRSLDLRPVTVIASSAEVYGRIDVAAGPVDEDVPVAPVSPYGVSKAAQDLLGHQYAVSYGLPVIRLRLFNHTGPRQLEPFVASSFARQIAEIERGLRPPRIQVGDLSSVRDFADVRDVVRAYEAAATSGGRDEVYNVCSGVPLSIRDLLERLLALSDRAIEIETDPERARVADIPVLVGSHTRFTEATGWTPVIPIERTLHDLLEWWRGRV